MTRLTPACPGAGRSGNRTALGLNGSARSPFAKVPGGGSWGEGNVTAAAVQGAARDAAFDALSQGAVTGADPREGAPGPFRLMRYPLQRCTERG